MSRCLTGERRLHPSKMVINGQVWCDHCWSWAPVEEGINGRHVGEHQVPEVSQ